MGVFPEPRRIYGELAYEGLGGLSVATQEEVEDAIFDSIVTAAREGCERRAAAALSCAEAFAWMLNPSQPHGLRPVLQVAKRSEQRER